MLRGLYSAATALDAASINHEVVSDNLAHATVPGYRRRAMTMETFDTALAGGGAGPGSLQGTRKGSIYTEFEPGDIHHTGARLDLALGGDAFFTVETPQGPRYTRNGVFDLAPDGTLQTKGGLPVSGDGGSIVIPEGTAEIVVTEEGTVLADGQEVGRLALAKFADPRQLIPVGTTLFAAPPGVASEPPTDAVVRQGYREGSNVKVVAVLVSMIIGMRHYEAAQRTMRTMSEAMEQRTRA